MIRKLLALAVALPLSVVACVDDGAVGEDVDSQEGAQTAGVRRVEIIMTAETTGETYQALSYPSRDLDGNGQMEIYGVPVYRLRLEGTDASGAPVRREWGALRFMPYYNDPANPNTSYSYRGFTSAGISNQPRKAVERYKPEYRIHNTDSPFNGAIVVNGTFYIHAGPQTIDESGWGSAGCVEVIGDFSEFKRTIGELAGADTSDVERGLLDLVSSRKLFVTYQQAARPNLKANILGEVSRETAADAPEEPVE